ncbi:cohesin domain-containing protein [Methanolobus profundi]|uniref:Cohesin domain-containing protein n=1 Tax=Methanolobus profundi TaxID=487685 RepID=A0A1I4SQ24_9EURY|nr:cohesin domain-containing protein [Methanolobus profundi]SFM66628.1 Cohesin domain-containing protein [Methanolobus profundi]
MSEILKSSSLISIVLFTCIILSLTGLASAESAIGLSPSQLNVEENEEFTLDIIITSDDSVSGCELELSYDPGLVSITSITEGDFFKQSGKSTIFSQGTIDNDAGTATGIYCAIIGDDLQLNPGTFATITLSSKGNAGITEMGLKNVIITNSAGEKLPVNIKKATLTIGDVETVAEEQEDIEIGAEEKQTGQNTLIPVIFALMSLYFIKRK